MKELSEKQIEVAVNWWAEKIVVPKFDNGDNSPTGGVTVALALMASTRVSEDKIGPFKEALIEGLKTNPFAMQGIHVDYGPCEILHDAMVKADIPTNNAPWKTNMSFHDGGVRVSYGYGQPWEDLLTSN